MDRYGATCGEGVLQGELTVNSGWFFRGSYDNRRLRIEYLRRQTLGSHLTYRPQFGSSLQAGVPGAFEDFNGHFEFVPVGTDWLRIIVEDPVVGAEKRFGRVVVQALAFHWQADETSALPGPAKSCNQPPRRRRGGAVLSAVVMSIGGLA